MKLRYLAIGVALLALQAGCVTGRRALTLTIPTQGASPPISGRVFLASVTDDRDFQNKPSEPSTPSIDGDVTKMSAQDKDLMIGR